MKGTARKQTRCGSWRVWARAATAVVAVLIASGPAHGFYWHNWPGSGLAQQQTLIVQTPHVNSPANPPSGTPPEIVSTSPPGSPPGSPEGPPVPVGPPVDKPPPVGPNSTPEPGTALLVAVGLGVLAGARRWKK